MSKKIGLLFMTLLLTFSVSLGSIFAQGASVAVSQIYHPPGESCITNPYFELHGFLPNAQIYVESLQFSEISCETHVNNTNSWPRTRYAMTDQNGYVLFPIFTGGVSGTYTMRFSDDVNSVTITFSTNENGDLIAGQSVPAVPEVVVPTEVVVQPLQQADAPMPAISEKWCAVQRFDTNPATDHFDPGTQVSMYGKGGDCRFGNNGLPRATRYSIDGQLFGEKQQSENYDTWDTSKYSQGTHIVCFMVASDRDTTWEHRDEQCRTYTIGSASQPSQSGNTNPPVVNNDCPEALPALVQPGTIAIVNTLSSDNLNVRSSPHVVKETKIDQLAPGSTFSVVGGPVCAEGYRWWQIGYNGKSGYAAEAGARAYNFVPNGTVLPYDPTGTIQNPAPIENSPVTQPGPIINPPMGWVSIGSESAPYKNLYCVSPGSRLSSGVTSLHDFYYKGYYYENVGCDASSGMMLLDLSAWGGWNSDRRDEKPAQEFGNYIELYGVYTPDFTGTVAVIVTLDINGRMFAIGTPLKSVLTIPNIWNKFIDLISEAQMAVMGISRIGDALDLFETSGELLDGSKAYASGMYFLKVADASGELGVDYYQLGGAPEIMGEYPSPQPNTVISVDAQTITLSTTVSVHQGQPVQIRFGEKANGSAYGTALAAWTQNPIHVTSISLYKLQ